MSENRNIGTGELISGRSAMMTAGLDDKGPLIEAIRNGAIEVPPFINPQDPDLETKPIMMVKASFLRWLNERGQIQKADVASDIHNAVDGLKTLFVEYAVKILSGQKKLEQEIAKLNRRLDDKAVMEKHG